MSSEMIGGGVIAAAVLTPVVLTAGAGWLAWQTGKLAVSATVAVNEAARQKQRQLEEAEKQKKTAALAAHRQMVDMCRAAHTRLGTLQTADLAAREALRRELQKICQEPLPEDTFAIQQLNARGLLVLERVLSDQSKLGQLTFGQQGDYAGFALSDLMEDLRLAVATAKLAETRGANVTAPDPKVLEREALNRRLAEVSARILDALDYIGELERNYGLTDANSAWFRSCFTGVDDKIRLLCSPRTTNGDLKQGVRSLEDTMKTYDMFLPTLQAQQAKLDALYPVYLEAAKALGEKVRSLRHFAGVAPLEAELHRLSDRAKRAEECAAIYRVLGAEGYLCYAWDQELTAMGYSVCSRKKITQMVTQKPTHARIDGEKSPFYEWTEDAVTQIYEISPQCRLQLIIHPDGTTTMETISAPADPATVAAIQKAHCSRMEELCRRLRENWFILQSLEETSAPETIHALYDWQDPAKNPWVRPAETESGMEDGTRTQTGQTRQNEMHLE